MRPSLHAARPPGDDAEGRLCGHATLVAMPAADLIVRAASAFGVPGADAVAAARGRITAVGDARTVMAQRGPKTRVIDVPGGLVCPGFHDAHAHLVPLAR